jgi:hypothetical protein
MKHDEFLTAIRSRAARIASGGSAMRGKGNKGCSKSARGALRDVNLRSFATSDAPVFRERLDAETQRIRSTLPVSARHWGLARKVMNIYLRDCFYTTYLEGEFDLSKAECLLELPLDYFTANELKHAFPRRSLPPWPGVKHLSPVENARFQAAASKLASTRGCARVHLDAFFWSLNRD